MKVWKCKKCGYLYDPRIGDSSTGIPKNTPFENIPSDWRCPRCDAKKDKFEAIEVEG
ncbi:rubredoxin [Methanoplanus sp. FWC-SCC4]|uniref:Rubredoxin n=1 Tax=Methanochimaera problematica TaxID=2609417 RepID=A0AA97FC85_9EURY|nr:rubredoxin [Methanoplanus sp. FWC-SCC4]WOF15573.1 rubredoxin [Methanoplanus sp. FWC-SCC4]